MWANILLIMNDLFILWLLWVSLLYHKRPWQKLNGNVFCVFGNHSVDLRVGGLTILCNAIDFGVSFSAVQWVGQDAHGMSLAVVTDHILYKSPVVQTETTCSHCNPYCSHILCHYELKCDWFEVYLISRWVRWEIWHVSMKLHMTSLIRIVLFSLFDDSYRLCSLSLNWIWSSWL